jgi:ceramide glucosyltransferase
MVLAELTTALAGVGVAQALVASRLVSSFVRKSREAEWQAAGVRPPVTVLKPLHGDEPLLEEALATLCRQDYPEFQIVFGVQDAADPAVAIVRRLQKRFPNADIALVADPALHGENRKVGNLINMLPVARHDVLVIADSDVHVRQDYLDRLIAALQAPGVGLVTTLYAGLPIAFRAGDGVDGGSSLAMTWRAALPARLGATQITHGFLPGALLARALGRQDCLGATMCVRRSDLQRIGGFRSLVDHLADDNVLGRRIIGLGLRVVLAASVVLTTVPEPDLGALFRHELRWARTIRALEPVGFAASVLQYPLAWALLTVVLAGGALWSIGLFLIAWVLRTVAALGVDNALAALWTSGDSRTGEERGSNDNAALAFCCPVWLLPLRDAFSVAVMLASYGGRQVDWRGQNLQADTPPPITRQPTANLPTANLPIANLPTASLPTKGNHAR